MFAPADFLDLEHTAHPKLFENQNYVWDALKQLASYLQFRLKPAILGELMASRSSVTTSSSAEDQSLSRARF